ncbi:MAG: YHS domain-containing protein [Candidatus Omnitrophica bacterium]|nr:YHS domain-containing protein [Candidatus Omnitrophota bacterium]
MNLKRIKLPIVGVMTMMLSFTLPVWSQGHDHHHHMQGDSHKSAMDKEVKHLFGNKKCPVMGGDVSAESYVEATMNDGNVVGRIYMCCDGCDKKVKKNFAELYKSFYRTDPKTGKEIDPLDLKNPTCPITGKPAAANVAMEYNGMLVHFCCAKCSEGFLKDPDEHLAKMVSNPEDFEYKDPSSVK